MLFKVPTKTGTAVHAFHLHVASPQAVILGGQVSHVDIHTPSLTLVCIIDNVSGALFFDASICNTPTRADSNYSHRILTEFKPNSYTYIYSMGQKIPADLFS